MNNMKNYNILESEYLPVIFKNKPRWMFYAILAMGLLLLMLISIAVGVLIAYVHCFIEHRTGKSIQALNYQITRGQINNTKSTGHAFTSSLIISRIIELCHSLVEDGHNIVNYYKSDLNNKTDDLKVFL